MRNKLFSFFGVFLIFVLLLSACSNKSSSGEGGSENSDAIVLGMWGDADEIKSEKELIKKFNEEYPDIKVEVVYKSWDSYWEWLTSQASSKDLPDIFKMDPMYFQRYADLGALKNLDSLIESSEFDTSNFEQNVLEITQKDGEQLALPRDANVITMAYNKDLFDNAGVDYPEEEMSWDEVLQLAQKLTLDKDGNNALSSSFDPDSISQYGIAVDSAGAADGVLEPQLWSNNARLLDDDGKLALDGPKEMEVLNFFKDLKSKYHVEPSTGEMEKISDDSFLILGSKRVAMSFIGSWNINTLEDADINFDIMMPPKFENGEVKTVVQPASYAMSPYTKKEEDTWKLLSWLAGPEGQKEIAKKGQSLPANKQAFDDYLPDIDDFNKQIFFDLQSKSIDDPYGVEDKSKLWEEYIVQKLQPALDDKKDLSQAIEEIAELWDAKR
ncbi:ABC transporter substrate-binding protein [Oceanobacillus neutriphilus]|uniref:Sugar ABC transporter substrate-binding protein n=1 Tax=Oceanobacillus neutriphilus TaxID=531815 RepID=A0ABQ2NXZ4_9BACI|nr:sugar ABC transporter substrate-binding protein [Oceanobacillus neutriphilus]GGP13258.1 sugar ABC transporter substrate-binding protein [Oceanobacillus neutriphilus]